MKKFILAVVILICSAATVGAQEKGFSGILGFQGSAVSLNGNSEFHPYELVIAPGYNFNDRFGIRLQGEFAIAHFNTADLKTYQENATLGAAVCYNIINNSSSLLEISVGAGNTITGNDWRYLYVDGGVKWVFGKKVSGMYIGVGVRYYNSHSTTHSNMCNLYATIGFRIN